MSVAQTNAAQAVQESSEELSSHQLISLLLDGALERVAQAKASVAAGDEESKLIYGTKLVGIINGLRGSLNMDQGGEIAVSLDSLYDYMVNRISSAEEAEEMEVLGEVGQLLQEVKDGWDGIETEIR